MQLFAYGSSMDRPQFQLHHPHALVVDKARLTDHRLCFPRWSQVRHSAVASVEPAVGEAVWGIVYDLDDGELARLDQREGFDPNREPIENTRNRATMTVIAEGGGASSAELYVATPSDEPGQPSAEYLAYLLRLAVIADLPVEYRRMLAGIAKRLPKVA